MNLIELHILQSFPVTCLNRDDMGAPKSAVFGGAQRARVSSQCWKRAIRMLAVERNAGAFAGQRGHYIAKPLGEKLVEKGLSQADAVKYAEEVCAFLGKQDSKGKDAFKTSVSLYMSPGELEAIACEISKQVSEGGKVEIKKGGVKKAIEAALPRDMADVAIFGRMVADDHSLMLEGAGMFSHALSTHKTSSEIDFFSAVDDLKPEDSEGAGHIGTLEFNAPCYYRYIGLNLDLLRDSDHLGHFTAEEFGKVLETFLRSCIEAVPSARKNSMFGQNPPSFVLALRREGQPLSLANAFEKPVRPSGGSGLAQPSREVLEEYWKNTANVYGLQAKEFRLPDGNLNDLIQGVTEDA